MKLMSIILSTVVLAVLIIPTSELQSASQETETSRSSNQLLFSDHTNRIRYIYKGSDVVMEFCLEPGKDFWGSVIIKMNMRPITTVTGMKPVFTEKPRSVEFSGRSIDAVCVTGSWKVRLSDQSVTVKSSVAVEGKVLIVDFQFPGGVIKGFNYGSLNQLREPKLIQPMTQAVSLPLPPILRCDGLKPFTAIFRIDTEKSCPGSRIYGQKIVQNNRWDLGSIGYDPFGDYSEDLRERFTLAFSPIQNSESDSMKTSDHPAAP